MKSKPLEFVKKHIFELLALFVLLTALICVFIGPFYTYDVGEGAGKIGLIGLISQNPSGPKTATLFIACFILLPVASIALIIVSFWKPKLISLPLILLLSAGIVSLVVRDSLSEAYAAATGWEGTLSVSEIHFAVIYFPVTMFVSALLALIAATRVEPFSIYDLVEAGMLVAMAIALSVIRLFRMPTGGSVNFQMLPLFILALRRGPLKGFIVGGVIYGLITCLTDGYGFATYPFDYLLGFGSVAIVGLFSPFVFGKEQKGYNLKGLIIIFLACLASTVVRFVAGTVSSMVIYDYGIDAAAIYNAGYIFISGGISTAVLMILYGPLCAINYRFPVHTEKPAKDE